MLEHDPEKWKPVFPADKSEVRAQRSGPNRNPSYSAQPDQALASAMPVPTMAVPVPVEPMQAAAKTAIGGATFNEPSIRAARSIGNASGSAIYPRHKTHRYGADGRGTHHGQDDTARTFHRITCSCTCEEFWESQALIFKPRYSSSGIEAELRLTGKPKRTVSQDRAGRRRSVSSSAAAGKMRRERMRKPAESAARDAARSGIGRGACRRMAGRGVSAEETAARRSARRTVTATG